MACGSLGQESAAITSSGSFHSASIHMPSVSNLHPYLRPALRPPSSTTWAFRTTARRYTGDPGSPYAEWPHPFYTSSRLTDRKFVFLAHASRFSHPSTLPQFLEHLQAIPRLNIKRATHCMYAYRAAGVAGQSDGGEGGSGVRLARLLRLTGCEDVVVVVWRWYGGVNLGADRWRRISEVAREALYCGGFLVKENEMKNKNKNGKKKKG